MRRSENFATEAALWIGIILIIGICLGTIYMLPILADGKYVINWAIVATSTGLLAAALIYMGLRSKRLANEKNRSERNEKK